MAALQGEIGASTVEERDRKIKLGFERYIFKTGNGLLKAIFQRMCGESASLSLCDFCRRSLYAKFHNS